MGNVAHARGMPSALHCHAMPPQSRLEERTNNEGMEGMKAIANPRYTTSISPSSLSLSAGINYAFLSPSLCASLFLPFPIFFLRQRK